MGIFSAKKSDNAGVMDTIIGEKARFKGEINSSGPICVNGEFEGRLSSGGEIIIARGSLVRGEVNGKNVIVSGRVEGNIIAHQSLEITKDGRVHGDLTGGRVVIEEGSSYRGRVKIEGAVEGETEESAEKIAKIIMEDPAAAII
jgi:cytoskeletal protein CcmA (bactofilin family)